tara:strand:- start:20755 stop:21810 length:1056 start_codon:yes stop_codon:yes gene_type:complete
VDKTIITKSKTMKKYFKTTALLVAVAFSQIACEKDQTEPKTYDKLSQNKSKQPQNINKAEDTTSLYTRIVDYATDLENEIAPEDLSWEEGMLSVESAINFTKGTLGMTSAQSEIVEFTVNATVSEIGGEYQLSGENALSLYNSLKSEINEAYTGSDLYANYGSDVFISVIDVDFNSNPSSSGLKSVGGAITIKYEPEPVFPFCHSSDSWKALDLLGRCVNGSNDNTDAAGRIETYLTHLDCNELWYLKVVNCQPVLWAVSSASIDGFTTINVWNGSSVSDCISANAINNTWIPGALLEADNINPSPIIVNNFPQYLSEVDYSVGKKPGLNGVAHELTVNYAKIVCYAYDPA